MVINGKALQWIEVDGSVPQGSILGPLPFDIFINGIDEGFISASLKLADDTKLFGKVESSDSRDKLKKDPRMLCEWSDTIANEIQYRQMQSYAYWGKKFGSRIYYGRQKNRKR